MFDEELTKLQLIRAHNQHDGGETYETALLYTQADLKQLRKHLTPPIDIAKAHICLKDFVHDMPPLLALKPFDIKVASQLSAITARLDALLDGM